MRIWGPSGVRGASAGVIGAGGCGRASVNTVICFVRLLWMIMRALRCVTRDGGVLCLGADVGVFMGGLGGWDGWLRSFAGCIGDLLRFAGMLIWGRGVVLLFGYFRRDSCGDWFLVGGLGTRQFEPFISFHRNFLNS